MRPIRAAAVLTLLLAGCEAEGFGPGNFVDDDAVGRWQSAVAMPGPRMRHSSAIYRGDLYVAGGVVGPGLFTASVIRLKPGATAWEEMAPMPYELAGMSLVVVGDTLYAVAGDGPRFLVAEQALFAYDGDRDEWSVRLPVPDQRVNVEAIEVDSELWLTGGPVVYDGDHTRDIPGEYILEYSPGSDSWTYGLEVPNPRDDHEAVKGDDGRIYLIGGANPLEENQNAQLDVLDTRTMAWVTVADSFATDRIGAAFAAPYVHVVGGDGRLDWHRSLDTRDYTWVRQPKLPYQVEWPQLVHWEGALWLIGGFQTTDNDEHVIVSTVMRLELDDLGAPR